MMKGVVGVMVVAGALMLWGLIDVVLEAWGRVDEDLSVFDAERQADSIRYQRR